MNEVSKDIHYLLKKQHESIFMNFIANAQLVISVLQNIASCTKWLIWLTGFRKYDICDIIHQSKFQRLYAKVGESAVLLR